MFRTEDINGTYYQIYYPKNVDPNNVNPNTQVAIYMHGGGGQTSGGNDAVNYLQNSTNINSIIIIPNNSARDTQSFYNDVVNVYDSFISENGIKQNNLVISGFSNGYRSTFGILDSYLEKHPNSNPASVYLVETYVQSDGIYQYNYDAYKKNGTMFYSYTPAYGSKNANSASSPSSADFTYEQINSLTEHGCNVVNILHPYVDADHNQLAYHFFGDDIIDFANGGVMLPSGEFKQELQKLLVGGALVKTVYCQANSDSEGWLSGQYRYIYQVRNPETGLWEEIDADKINTLDKIRNFFGIVSLPLITDEAYLTNLNYIASLSLDRETFSTDSDTFLGNISNMYNVIKSTTFATNSYVSSFGGSSTSKIPSSIPDVINKYFSSTSNILCSLGVFLKKCEESNTLMEETEKDIGTDAGSLGDYGVIDLGNNGGAPTYNQPIGGNPSSGDPQPSAPSNPRELVPSDEPTTDIPQDDGTEDPSNWRENFPDYDKLHTTSDKVVFNCNDEYRVIVHRDGETITGVEYYYDLGSNENVASALRQLKEMYGNSDIENILIKDGCVKVVFNESVFNSLSVSEFRNKFSNLKEITMV